LSLNLVLILAGCTPGPAPDLSEVEQFCQNHATETASICGRFQIDTAEPPEGAEPTGVFENFFDHGWVFYQLAVAEDGSVSVAFERGPSSPLNDIKTSLEGQPLQLERQRDCLEGADLIQIVIEGEGEPRFTLEASMLAEAGEGDFSGNGGFDRAAESCEDKDLRWQNGFHLYYFGEPSQDGVHGPFTASSTGL